MYKKIAIIFLISICVELAAQHTKLNVVDGGIYFQGAETFIVYDQVDIRNNGTYQADSNTQTFINAPVLELVLEGDSIITFGDVFIDGNVELNNDIKTNDINLQSGVVEMRNNTIDLGGSIWNERNESYIFSKGSGEIIKTVDLKEGELESFGNLGLSFVAPDFSVPNFELRRGHSSQQFDDQNSINRYFKSNTELDFGAINFEYLDHEYLGEEEFAQNLFYQRFVDKEWEATQNVFTDTILNIVSGQLSGEAFFFTLFEDTPEGLVIPQILTLNNDGINDVLNITGLQKYPNNKLTIFNRWGDTVFEAQPYKNNWNGVSESAAYFNKNEILPVGTYFILFQPDISKEFVVKDYLEITH